MQWDPDHDPSGTPLRRRALQLWLRGETLRRYAREWVIAIEDISELVRDQRTYAQSQDYDRLMTPRERVYPISDRALAARLGLQASAP
jgi:hypothetical protein